MLEKVRDHISEGQALYEEWREGLMADPALRAIYEEEARKKELWLQLVEARLAAGLTQEEVAQRMGTSKAQVARIERDGTAYTLRTLQRYVAALGDGYRLNITVTRGN